MSVKVTAIALIILSLNLGSNTVQADNTSIVAVSQVSTDSKTKALDLTKELKAKQKRVKLKKVVTYLTTRVHKTAYVFSGSSVSGWDCSGLVRYTYKRLGITLEHSANKQGHVGKRVSKPKVGDIVVFAYQGSTSFYHSAIYIGNGLIINANAMYQTTVIQPLTDFSKSQIRFVRVIT
jgi:cell wall-associated NlpC family hydrolase